MLALNASRINVQNSWLFIHLELAKNKPQLKLRDMQQNHGPLFWEENDTIDATASQPRLIQYRWVDRTH
jgi:hypothetical protein